MLNHRLLVLWIYTASSTSAYAGDTLQVFAPKCDQAIGVTVPDFNCDQEADDSVEGIFLLFSAVVVRGQSAPLRVRTPSLSMAFPVLRAPRK
jgi:hypothetical protein